MWVFDNALNTICCSFNDIHASAGGQESTILLESLARVSGTNIPSDYLSKEQVHIDICLGIYNLLGQDKKARQWVRCEGRGLDGGHHHEVLNKTHLRVPAKIGVVTWDFSSPAQTDGRSVREQKGAE